MLKWWRLYYLGLASIVCLAVVHSSIALDQSVAQVEEPIIGELDDDLNIEELIRELTEAEVYNLRNDVTVSPGGKSPRPARNADILVHRDHLTTGRDSLAELLFSKDFRLSELQFLARLGSNSEFTFIPGTDIYKLANKTAGVSDVFQVKNGTFLAAVPPDAVPPQFATLDVVITPTFISPSDTQTVTVREDETVSEPSPGPAASLPPTATPPREPAIEPFSGTDEPTESGRVEPPLSVTETPELPENEPVDLSTRDGLQTQSYRIIETGDAKTVFTASYNASTNTTLVLNLVGNLKIANPDDPTNFELLQPGQLITAENGVLGPVQTFSLATFYRTSSLAQGLGPGQEEFVEQQPPRVRDILNKLRPFTIAAVENQTNFLAGLCSLDSLGSFSTLATNCIEVPSDAPIDTFTDDRESITPVVELPDPMDRENPPEPLLPEDIPDIPDIPDTPLTIAGSTLAAAL